MLTSARCQAVRLVTRGPWRALPPPAAVVKAGGPGAQAGAALGSRSYCCRRRNLYERWNIERKLCLLRSFRAAISPWNLLNMAGVPKAKILRFRRSLFRYNYPWLKYCIPAALIMAAGDLLEQYCYREETKEPWFKTIDWRRTLKFAVIGFALIGPVLSKWSLFMNRTLRCQNRAKFIVTRLLFDLFLLSPLLLGSIMAIYDYRQIKEVYPKIKCLWAKKYKKPFYNIMKFNIQTRPIVILLLAYFIPCALRRPIRGIYEVIFAAYVSHEFACSYLGCTEKEMPKKKDSQRRDGSNHSMMCNCLRKLFSWLCSSPPK